MSDAVLAAIITTVGTIIAALIARGENLWLRGPLLSAYSLTIFLAVLMGSVVWFVVDDGTESRLWRALPELPDYQKQIYANAGFGFVYPGKWNLEDYAFKFGGGGEVALVRDRAGDFETQSMRFSLVDIPQHHWSNPQSEFVHFRKVSIIGAKSRGAKR